MNRLGLEFYIESKQLLSGREKEAGVIDTAKSFSRSIPGTLVGTGLGIGVGGYAGYKQEEGDKLRNTLLGTGLGGITGAMIGSTTDALRAKKPIDIYKPFRKEAGLVDGFKSLAASHPATLLGGTIGTLGGAYSGYVADDENKLRNILIGAGIGGLAGGGVGYATDRMAYRVPAASPTANLGSADKQTINSIKSSIDDYKEMKDSRGFSSHFQPKPRPIMTQKDVANMSNEGTIGNDIAMDKMKKILGKGHQKNANFLQNSVIPFIKAHPKAVEGAGVGGILGGASELIMPSNKDMYGNPSTNISEIGKRALIGAAMGGAGGELKTRIRSGIQKLAYSPTLNWMKNNIGTTVGGLGGAGLGGYLGYNNPERMMNTKGEHLSPDSHIEGMLRGGFAGGVLGGTLGHVADTFRPMLSKANIVGTMESSPETIKHNNDVFSIRDLQKQVNNAKRKEVENTFRREQLDDLISSSGVLPKGAVMPTNVQKAKVTSIRNPNETKQLMSSSTVKTAFMSSMLQNAGKFLAKNPQAGGAVAGAGLGLAANTVSGEDHPLFSAAAGAGLGALGGRKLLANVANRKNPLLGKAMQQGAQGELRNAVRLRSNSTPSSGIGSVKATSLNNAPSIQDLAQTQGTPVRYPVQKPSNPINIPPRVPESLPGTY